MGRTTRAGAAALALALGGAAQAMAQIPGMPLFTNPRFSTGFRIHADIGQNTQSDPNGSSRVVQGGANFVLGPVGIEANLGSTLQSLNSANSCTTAPTAACLKNHYTLSGLAQLKLYGGGMSNLTISGFGGVSYDIDSANYAPGANKLMTIPVGAAIGLHVPIGMASLNLWGAPRWVMPRYQTCGSGCVQPDGYFAWAVGADLPIFKVLSIRAAYDSYKPKGATQSVNVFGLGASIGIGGMR